MSTPLQLYDFVDSDDIEALNRTTAQALGLPGIAYASPEFFELERRELFPKTWVAAAMAHQLPDPGDVLPVNVAGWPLVFVRGRDGMMRCFHNICRHRAAAVVLDAEKDAHSLRCPWHGWNYGLDGELRGTPEFGGEGVHDVEGFDRGASGLAPIRVEQWFDFLFVNIDGQAPALQTHLQPFLQRFRQFEFDRFHYAGTWEHVYEANWKIAVEGAIEDYHLCWLHPQVTEGAKRSDRCQVEHAQACYYCVSGEWQKYESGRVVAKGPQLPRLDNVEGSDGRSYFFLNLFPTGVMGFGTDYAYAGTWLPDGVARTKLTFHYYHVDHGATDEALGHARQVFRDLIEGVFRQDDDAVRTVHDRARLRDEIGMRTRFSPFWETAVHQFQKDVVMTLQR